MPFRPVHLSSRLKGRRPASCVKRIKGKKGKPDVVDLLVEIDLAVHLENSIHFDLNSLHVRMSFLLAKNS